jgi:Skp family chaperone for outer membrane proteins
MQVAKRINLEIDDKFHSKDYRFLTNPEKCFQEFQEIMRRVGAAGNKVSGNYKQFESAVNKLQNALVPNNVDEALAALDELRKTLEKDFKMREDLDTKENSVHSGIQEYD